jgi:valyl-tRNA synthetase
MSAWVGIGSGVTGVVCATGVRPARAPCQALDRPGPLLWCVRCGRALGPAEALVVETPATVLRVLFGRVEGREVIVEITRPEMLAACVALCTHPGDERHIPLLGCRIAVPAFGHTVPVWPWPGVDMTRAGGILPVCTFAGPEDIGAWRDERLGTRAAVGADGRLTALAGAYRGMRPAEARSAVTASLAELGLVLGRRMATRVALMHAACEAEAEYVFGQE